ncbi:hypothetical protein [Spirillospora sp. NPDC047279]|uniref:hypothetical protein n=1 Tax=Spirillospora sp. NPDC047279 TaxID=3155478 RepID=UPI0034085E46
MTEAPPTGDRITEEPWPEDPRLEDLPLKDLRLEDIPPLRGPRPAGAERVRRRPAPPDTGVSGVGRRNVLRGIATAGASVGLGALGVFPQARQALAAGYAQRPGYQILGRCPSYAANHNCSPGCGPSVVCPTCCRTSGSLKGYHKSGKSHPGYYMLRPNQCYSGGWDGWLWAYSKSCGSCRKGVTWRCHDGWKKSAKGSWYKTICRKATSCRN